jgi:serine/threonine protein kinase
MPIVPGTRLGGYQVQDYLGQGAMGVVYRAYHPDLERTGAVKVLQAISPDADTVARFRHEAQAIARLRHPNIVDVYDFGEFQGTPYMIVEFVPGGSLSGRMTDGSLDRASAVKYLRGIAAGLDYAHGHGIIHRDVKPANVLLTSDDAPVLADFGLAKLMEGSSLKSMTGVTTGTPAYMAPEQVAGAHPGPAADRYSLASMAYEMLTGAIPFDGQGLMEVLYAQVHRYPSPPSERDSTLGPQVDAVIMRGLAKDPTLRWESCTAFVEALEEALQTPSGKRAAATMVVALPAVRTKPLAPVARPAATMVATAPIPAASPSPAPEPSPSPTRSPSRTPWRRFDRRLLALAALLLLLLSFGVCAVAAQATTLTVNPTRAPRGQDVRVTATHVPANQAGEIQLHSVVHTYPFQADANGKVDIEMTVPDDAELGDHVVKICWDNTCHQDAGLRVVAGVAEASPSPSAGPSTTPSGSPSPGASPTANPTGPRTTPTPGSTPRPTPRPTSNPTSTPTTAPKPTPTPPPPSPTPPPPPPPSPTPTINPCPTTSPTLTSPPATVAAASSIMVSGQGFTPGKSVTVTVSGAMSGSKATTVSPSGTFSVSFTVPLLATGTATATATDACGRTASRQFTILAGL